MDFFDFFHTRRCWVCRGMASPEERDALVLQWLPLGQCISWRTAVDGTASLLWTQMFPESWSIPYDQAAFSVAIHCWIEAISRVNDALDRNVLVAVEATEAPPEDHATLTNRMNHLLHGLLAALTRHHSSPPNSSPPSLVEREVGEILQRTGWDTEHSRTPGTR